MSETGPTPGFFFFGSALLTFGSTFAPAMIAPRGKLFIAIAFGLVHAIGGPLSSVDAIHQFPSYGRFALFAYGLGPLLAIVAIYIIQRRKAYAEVRENAVEPSRPAESSSAGAPEGR